MNAHLSHAAPWVVLKFGGTSVATAPRWRTIADLARDRVDAGLRTVIVVSAVSGLTNRLQAIIDRDASATELAAETDAIRGQHLQLIAELGIAPPPATLGWLDHLAELARQAPVRRGEFRWQAELLSMGELISSSLGAAFLASAGLRCGWLDSRRWLKVEPRPNQSDWARWLSVSCTTMHDPAQVAALAAEADCFVAPGFMGSDAEGATCLLGRGGSDTSAAYLGALLGAARVEIWTDVAGMFSADPRQVPKARLLSRIDYAEAQEIATTGGKVLHPRCIGPVREAVVPMWIKDTQRPELDGTVIGDDVARDVLSVKAISSRRGIMLVSVESVGMWQQVGFLADVFAQFKKHGLSVDMIGSSETNVTISLDPTENLVNSNVLEALCADLATVCRVKVIGPCTAISLVGRGIRSLLGKLGPVWNVFGAMPIHLISQSSNDLNLTFVVDEARADGLVPRIHEALVKGGALRADDRRVFGPSWTTLYRAPTEVSPEWWRRERDALLRLAAERTPRYVYHRETIRERAAQLRTIAAVDRWFYATKANAHPAVLRTIVDAGFDLECVSPGEIDHARATCPDARLLFTPNLARRADYLRAAESHALLTIERLDSFAELGDALPGREVSLRIDLGSGHGHHDKVRTGGAKSKFGIGVDQLGEAARLAQQHGVRITVLHAHLGSGILDAAHFGRVYQELLALADSVPSVRALNIGGGFGIAAHPDDSALDLARVGELLATIKQANPQYALWMEPGRYLVAEAGALLARVNAIKHKYGRHFIGLDAGMHNLLRPALYDAHHPIVNLTRLDEAATLRADLVGPICESGDVLGGERELPPTGVGDVFLIAQAGAYGAVMASNYNRRDAADEVML
ncbi:MAG TPA: bifunctional aspartate kinase/diaminopimelate decarboxylase [Patescibacteria group bacterium]|nr:bifunctional aspartate kinase/diaminopimelate decarboxylase [Patescibacteria group bacterium]